MLAAFVSDLTSVSGGGHAIPLDTTISLCARLMPPPVPPWLLDSPGKLRHLVANCSAWQRYSKMCATDIKTNYPVLWAVTQTSGFHEAGPGKQWIPTFILLSLTALLVLAVACSYFLYRHNWLKPSKSVKYQKQLSSSTSRDYCSPGLTTLTPSVTVETQLSLWALEDHTPFTLDANPSLAILTSTPATSYWSVSKSDTNLCPASSSDTEEVVLQPWRLADRQLPFVDVLPSSSIHAHPVDTNYDYPSLELFRDNNTTDNERMVTQRYSELPFKYDKSYNSNSNSNSVTRSGQNGSEFDMEANSQLGSQTKLVKGKRRRDNESLTNSGQRQHSLLKTCRNAGAKLVTKISKRPSLKQAKQKQETDTTGQKFEASIARLRQSLTLTESKISHRRKIHNRKSDGAQSEGAKAFRPNSGSGSNEDCNGSVQCNERTGDEEGGHVVSSSRTPSYSNVNSNTHVISSSNDGIYSFATDIPLPHDSHLINKRTKWTPNIFTRRPHFLKNHKFFSKS